MYIENNRLCLQVTIIWLVFAADITQALIGLHALIFILYNFYCLATTIILTVLMLLTVLTLLTKLRVYSTVHYLRAVMPRHYSLIMPIC